MFELISVIILLILGFLGLTWVIYLTGMYLFDDMPSYPIFVLGWIVAGLLVGYFVRSPP
jgi:hypothetical protein